MTQINKMRSQIFLGNLNLKRNKKMMRVIHRESKSFQRAENVLINYALQKRFTRKLDQELKITNIVSFVKTAIRTIITTSIVNFVSKYIQTVVKTKTMTNGLAVITAKDG